MNFQIPNLYDAKSFYQRGGAYIACSSDLYKTSRLYIISLWNSASFRISHLIDLMKTYAPLLESKKVLILKHKELTLGGIVVLVILLVAKYFNHRPTLTFAKDSREIKKQDVSSQTIDLPLNPSVLKKHEMATQTLDTEPRAQRASFSLPAPSLPAPVPAVPTLFIPQASGRGDCIFNLEATLNFARIGISVPEVKHEFVTVDFLLCVDISFSMQVDNRLSKVRSALVKFLKNAQSLVNRDKASIEIAVVSFSSCGFIDSAPICLIKNNEEIKSTLEKVIKNLQVSESDYTNINKGLQIGIGQMQKMRGIKDSRRAFVLLTDGGEDVTPSHFDKAKQQIAEMGAELFVVAIGVEKTDKTFINTLNTLVKNDVPNFKGSYVDTNIEGNTIEAAIMGAYNQTLQIFSDFRLTSSPNIKDRWKLSFSGKECPILEGQNVDLKDLEMTQSVSGKITLLIEKFPVILDMRDIFFTLTFIDFTGKRNELRRSWNPTTMVEPKILNNVS